MIERLIILKGARIKKAWVEETVSLLQSSAVVVQPTETVHGLGCRYDSSTAIERIRSLKGRTPGKPMIFLIPGTGWLDNLCEEVPRTACKLIEHFWPGPLTLVLKAAESARKIVPGLGKTVAVRQCGHPFTAKVLAELDLPIISTSLNRSGQPLLNDPQRSLELLADVWKNESRLRPDLAVIDSIKTSEKEALPSTVLAVDSKGMLRIIRRGACPLSEIYSKTGIIPP